MPSKNQSHPHQKTALRSELREQLKLHSEKCIECKLCRKECKFLRKYGNPKQIADTYAPSSAKDLALPFECSLCGLCAAVCPVGVNPAAMFLEMRREAVAAGGQDFADYGVILNYEKRGTSRRYSYYALPENCDTVLFPGCALPGTRPDKVKGLFDHLQKTFPALGIVLDCCTKPSHDLGRDSHFHAMFTEMKEYLRQHGVKNVLVACPNCYRVFNEYGSGLHVKTVYEYLADTSLPQTAHIPATVTIHDPCGTRNEKQVHTAIRRLATNKSLTVEEMKHHGPKTICCGEGGSVGCINPAYSRNWGIRRKEEAAGQRILTYCAGCANFLGGLNPTSHILDVLFEPEKALAGQAKVSKAPWTYLNRLRLKSYFKKNINAAVSRERTFSGENRPQGGMLKRLAILSALIGFIIAVRMTGATQYIEQEKLRALIEGYGAMAPVIFMLTYAVAPALFLPGLPITIVGGILFGPFWGVVYSITGATTGACIAFLISRYVGREWIEGKLKSPKWKQLDTMVEQHGWKAVAFTRLIPLFPFNLLNYAFGLTKVKFLHYALASFICMLPACIAFIVFSSSLLEIIKGNVTPSFIFGIVLIITVSMIPFIYNRFKAQKEKTS
ncbi:MAG: VTT domain-containing protein [Desulfobulbaceae bacterium]|nr:VTT domain-containing protein [Desulfobulbaceae bacterium]